MSKLDAVILGSGVIALTIALELTKKNYKVAIVAKDLPSDSLSVGFASPWAGCNWCSFAGDNVREQQWDKGTYEALFQISKDQPDLVEFIQFYSHQKESIPDPWFKDLVKEFGYDDNSTALEEGMRCTKYKSFITHAPNYLAWLHSQLKSKGVRFHRQRLASLYEAYNLPAFGPVDLVINATGLGSRTLIGVEDAAVHPIRGQTVLVKAPGVKTCYMKMTKDKDPIESGSNAEVPKLESEPVYIIPRPGKEGHVVCGGSYSVDEWNTLPDYALAKRILQKTYELCPALAGPNGKSWEDIEIVGHNVGLRPARHGGARLELEEKTLSNKKLLLSPSHVKPVKEGKKVAVLHAYGIGPAGYQASIGMAQEAGAMVDSYFAKTQKAKL